MIALTELSPKKIGWEPYLYLVYLGFMFFQPFFDPSFGLTDWVLTFALIAVFLPVYLTNFARGGRDARVGVAVVALLGFVGMFINTGSSCFFIYAACGAPHVVGRPRQAVALMAAIFGLVTLAFFLSPLALPERYWAFFPAALFAPLLGTANIFEAEKGRANAKLRRAQGEVERLAKVAERERIARDLHDLLGHTLSIITLKSELASKLARTDPARAGTEMAEVAQVSRGALKEVREAVRGYRLRDLGGELRAAKEMLAAAGVHLESFAQPLTLTPAQEGTLALALREAVTNVVRHAHATRCTVRLTQKGGEARLVVEDDGTGRRAADGTGVTGMRERAQGLGGGLSLTGGSSGTRLLLTLPVAAGTSICAEDNLAEPAVSSLSSTRVETS